MSIKYIARFNGQIVGKRTSKDRIYTHAYVMQRDEAAERAEAYGYVAGSQDRKSFDYHSRIVAEGVNHEFVRVTSWRKEPDLELLARSAEEIEGGWEAFAERRKQIAIRRFEAALANGNFNPFVGGWASRQDLAEKAARQFEQRLCKTLAIVPAEKV